MKLIDILVAAGDETPLFGVHTKYLAMDPDGRVHGYCEMPSPTVLGWGIPDALYSTDGRGCLIQIDRDDVDGQWQSAIITREQYEAALDAKNEGWIEWGGGKHPPVSTNTVVDVKFKNGNVQSGYPAGEYSWVHAWQNSNIIAYRLHQPQEAEQAKADDEADLNECIGQDAAPVWNGEGLPPVGCECQYRKHKKSEQSEWFTGVVKYASEFTVVIQPVCYPGETVGHPVNFEFRKVSSEADKKRDEAVKTIMLTGRCQSAAEEIYDLVAAGKVPGMKLEV